MVILKALIQLDIRDIKVFFESYWVNDPELAGSFVKVGPYFNRRFYKYTETSLDGLKDVTLPSHQAEDKSLIIFEGPTFPTKTELNLATICYFDLFTLTNFSFMDLALYLGLTP